MLVFLKFLWTLPNLNAKASLKLKFRQKLTTFITIINPEQFWIAWFVQNYGKVKWDIANWWILPIGWCSYVVHITDLNFVSTKSRPDEKNYFLQTEEMPLLTQTNTDCLLTQRFHILTIRFTHLFTVRCYLILIIDYSFGVWLICFFTVVLAVMFSIIYVVFGKQI